MVTHDRPLVMGRALRAGRLLDLACLALTAVGAFTAYFAHFGARTCFDWCPPPAVHHYGLVGVAFATMAAFAALASAPHGWRWHPAAHLAAVVLLVIWEALALIDRNGLHFGPWHLAAIPLAVAAWWKNPGRPAEPADEGLASAP